MSAADPGAQQHPPHPNARPGFTLIEVLAALLLIGIVVPAAMHGISAASTAASVAKHRTEAAALAASKLNELVGTNSWQNGGMSGDFGDEFPGYQWSADMQEWTRDATLNQLDVHVTWGAGGPRNTVSISTLVYPGAPVAVEGNQPTNTAPKKGPLNGNTNGSGGGLP